MPTPTPPRSRYRFDMSLRNGLLFLILLVLSAQAMAVQTAVAALNLPHNHNMPIGKHLFYFLEGPQALTLEQVTQKFSDNQFTSANRATLNFGIGSNPVWLKFDAINKTQAAILQRLSIETSWLDNIDVYISSPGLKTTHFFSGDSQPFNERQLDDRFFIFDHNYAPGLSSVYMRIQTPDPIVLPIYLTDKDAFFARQKFDSYSYGVLYGGIFVLLAYNLMLFLSLKNSRYLYYSIYLTFFLLANSSYTGHGFQYLWGESVRWQIWSNPVLMVLYSISGLVFALRFLDIKTYYPRMFSSILFACIGVVLLQLLSIINAAHEVSLLIAFTFMFLFSIAMLILGGLSLYAGNKSAKYFLLASVLHTTASGITVMVVWSFIPYSVLAYRAIDIGMMLDAILLAMALAYQFRLANEEKVRAEKLANVDPLTQINNRRAFYDIVLPMWSCNKRSNNSASIMILDIDRFKLINDTYGHAQGDIALVKIAQTLSAGKRAGDVLARWGGEEFIIFLPDTNVGEAQKIAERLRSQIEAVEMKLSSERLQITVSIGLADNLNVDGSLDTLIAEADSYLYKAKDQGRNCVVSRWCTAPVC